MYIEWNLSKSTMDQLLCLELTTNVGFIQGLTPHHYISEILLKVALDTNQSIMFNATFNNISVISWQSVL
jgi:hypothetical protein